MDLKKASRALCKKCGGDECIDKLWHSGSWYIYCQKCGAEGVVAVGADRPAALMIWNKGNEAPEKVEVNTSHFGKELDKAISALLASDDGQTSTVTPNPCPSCGKPAKILRHPTSGRYLVMCEDAHCADKIAFVGLGTNHTASNGYVWKFEYPEQAIYAWNKLYPQKLTDENKALLEDQGRGTVYNTRPERVEKAEFGHNIFDDLSMPKDTELRYVGADEWTHVSLGSGTTPGDNT